MNTNTLRNNRNLVMTVAAVLLAAGTVARANEVAADVPARTVHYADLNLNTDAGVAVLYKRIRNAAEAVCGDAGERDAARMAATRACVDRAVAEGVNAVGVTR